MDADNPLSRFPVVIDVPVRWSDMDAFQHVNNVTYFNYFEIARIAYFEKLDIKEYLDAKGLGPILGSASCQYKFPLTYPDTLKIGARISRMEPDRFHQEYLIYSPRHQRVAALGTGVIVNFDYDQGCKTKISSHILEQIQSFEGGSLS